MIPFAAALEEDEAPRQHCLSTFLKHIGPQLSKDGPWLAGGSLRSYFLQQPVADYDIYFSTQQQYGAFFEFLQTTFRASVGEVKGFAHKLHVTMPKTGEVLDIQLIESFHAHAAALLEHFDFTVSQFITDGQYIYGAPYSFQDLQDRRLRFFKLNSPPDQLLLRFAKYSRYGFIASPETLRQMEVFIRQFDRSKLSKGEHVYRMNDPYILNLSCEINPQMDLLAKELKHYLAPLGLAGPTVTVTAHDQQATDAVTPSSALIEAF